MKVAENLNEIEHKIEKACKNGNRDINDITIIAVTKYVSLARAKEAIEAGISHLGENRVEGFLEKFSEIQHKANWHFIGTLQSRKVKEIIEHVDYIHSLDRLSLAKEINKRAIKPISCFVQVNTSGEESKHGLNPNEVESFINELKKYEKIKVVGLMTMAPFVNDEQILRSCFKELRKLRDRIMELQLNNAPCSFLSMGMSNDFHIAIEEGATHIRLGTSLVGKDE